MTDLFTWTAGGSYPDISGLLTMSETRPFPQARDQLLAYLHLMSDRYPRSRKDIMQAYSDLNGVGSAQFSLAGRSQGWSCQFTVMDTEPHAVISLSLVKTGSVSQGLTRADAEDKRREVSAMPKPPDPNRRRAGNAERTRYAEHITTQYAIGMLEPAEFEERVDAVNAARYADELPPLIAGLDPLPPPEEKPRPAPVTLPDSGLSPVQAVARGAMLPTLATATALSIAASLMPMASAQSAVVGMTGFVFLIIALALAVIEKIGRGR
jgi:hypothetical protein